MSGVHGPYFIDPELAPGSATDAQMYALADGAMQAHQEQHQFAGLVQAATAAADEVQQHDQSPSQTSKRNPRKRKRGQQDVGNDDEEHVADTRDPPIVSSASALFRRPSTTAKKYTRPPMSRLFSSLQLSPEDFLQLQSAAKSYMLDPNHPERQDTVGQRGRGDSELVKLRLFNCVKDFLENEGNGPRYFGPDVPGDEGQPRTMVWPQDRNDIISAVIPLMRRMVTNERQRQYAIETRKGGRAGDDTDVQPESNLDESEMTMSHGDIGHLEDPGRKSLFESFTGCQPKDYVVGPTYDWPMLQPHLVPVLPKMGLPDLDSREVVSSLSYHLRYTHQEGYLGAASPCSPSCLSQFLDHIMKTGYLDHGTWQTKVGDSMETKRKKMRSILRELFNYVKAVISKEDATPTPQSQSASAALQYSMMLQIYVMRHGERIKPRREVQAMACPYRHTILQDAAAELGPNDVGKMAMKVLCPEGLVTVEDDATWQRVKKLSAETEWMDGTMKVIVELT